VTERELLHAVSKPAEPWVAQLISAPEANADSLLAAQRRIVSADPAPRKNGKMPCWCGSDARARGRLISLSDASLY
jgi:hypothetical protein